MTITYVGSGTAATANNASVTAGAISGIAVGDLALIQVSIRTGATGVVVVPPGWTEVRAQGGHSIVGRYWQTGDSIPLIGFSGGAANADCIARAFAFRGVAPDMLTSSVNSAQANASAQNIAYPALATPGDRHALVLALWKADDATALSTPAGFTAVGLTAPTAGDDALQGLYYWIQTTDTDLPSGSVTVTGGAAAVSSALALALHPAATVTVTPQDEYPPRNLISVTDLVVGLDVVTIYRSVGGVETALRGSSSTAVTDTSLLLVDDELPFGVPVKYVVKVGGSARYETSTVTYTLPGGKVALSDAITGNSVETVIMAWDELAYSRQSSTFQVAGRNIVVAGDLGQWEADITFYMASDSANESMRELLETATEAVMQIRQPGGYAGVDSYVAVTSVRQPRFSQDGTDPRRTWVLHCVQVDGWADALMTTGYTLQDIYDFYGSSGKLSDLAADYATLLGIGQASW